MTPSQFSLACGVDPRWVRNAARILGWSLRHTVEEARHVGLVRRLQEDLRVPLETADRLASEALSSDGPEHAVVEAGEIARVVVDVRRYLSDFSVRLARAMAHDEPCRRRFRVGQPGAVERARRHGLDVGLLRSSLKLTPAERIRRLDENMEFVRALRASGRRGCADQT